MPQNINRVPPGLLSLLDIKSLGLNPVQLSDLLSATLELGELYVGAISLSESGITAAIAAPGTVSPVTGSTFRPGAGEIWVVEKVAAISQVAVVAGATYRFRVVVYDSTLGPPYYAGSLATGTVGQIPIASTDRALIIGPGQGVGIHFEDVTVGGNTFLLNGRVSKLRF